MAYKRRVPSRYLTSLISVGLFIMGLTMPPLLMAQGSEQKTLLQCDSTKSAINYQNDLKINPQSSLENYCLGELWFKQRNYQSCAVAYRSALQGDGYPSWTRVWSHIQLGKVLDIVGERAPAVREYQLAIEINDNTRGAVDEARKLIQQPFKLN